MNNPDLKFNVSPIAVGRSIAADGSRKTLAYSALELERARLAAARVLDAFHFRTGGNVMFTRCGTRGRSGWAPSARSCRTTWSWYRPTPPFSPQAASRTSCAVAS